MRTSAAGLVVAGWLAGGCGEPCERPFYRDFDGDGFGDPDRLHRACELSDGFVRDAQDCDDEDAGVHPDALEACNGVDDDCDGVVDPEATVWYADGDGDGFGRNDSTISFCGDLDGFSRRPGDCDDTDDRVYPGAVERCDGVDQNCDQLVDNGAPDENVWWFDFDSDGFGGGYPTFACRAPYPGYMTLTAGDCDDYRSDVNPNGVETCDFYGSVDEDCDGRIDNEDRQGALGVQAGWVDVDHDGFGAGPPELVCLSDGSYVDRDGDCDDFDPYVSPNADETCVLGDQDCDGLFDEMDPDLLGVREWWHDIDGDGLGGGTSSWHCVQPLGSVDQSDDCDDLDPMIGGDLWWSFDADADGAGVGGVVAGNACTPPLAGMPNVARADCDDGDDTVAPGALDACGDGVDADCSGYDRTCAQPWSGLTNVATAALGWGPADGFAVGDVDEDLVDEVIYVTGGVGMATVAPPELPSQLGGGITTEPDGLLGPVGVVPSGAGHRVLVAVDSFGTLLRYQVDGAVAVYLDSVPVDVSGPVEFAPSGLPVGTFQEEAFLVGTASTVARMTYHPLLGTLRESWTRSSGGGIAGGGDPDDDGDADMAAGEVATDSVYVLPADTPGGGPIASKAAVLLNGAINTHFGAALAWVDWDDDGVTDLVVGAPNDDGGGAEAGAIFVFSAPAGVVAAGEAIALVRGTAAGDHLGASLAVVDLDGDGQLDLLVGAPDADTGGSGSGAVVSVLHGASGVVDPLSGPVTFLGGVDTHLGRGIAVGDVDGVDGVDLVLRDDENVWWLPGAP